MLAREIIVSAIEDIKMFFYDEADLKINYELDSTRVSIASVKSIRSEAKIHFSIGVCDYNVHDIEDFIYILLIVSHELAHYISDHHFHIDSEDLDSVSIESRADFFGCQIALTLLSFGSRIISETQRLKGELAILTIKPKNILNTIVNLNIDLFCKSNSKKYPTSQYRSLILITACISFFSVYSKENNEEIDKFFLRELISGDYLSRFPLIDDYEATILEISNRLESIHKVLQLKNPMSVAGIRFEYAPYLSTSYILPDKYKLINHDHNQSKFRELFASVLNDV